MPTILESLENALEALERKGIGKGKPVFDDLEQAIIQLKESDLAILQDKLDK